MAKGDAEGRELSIGAPHARYPHEKKEGAETKEGGTAMKIPFLIPFMPIGLSDEQSGYDS